VRVAGLGAATECRPYNCYGNDTFHFSLNVPPVYVPHVVVKN